MLDGKIAKFKSRPILFSGPMVRAILEGRKTQTRRIVKPQPSGEFLGPKIYHPSVTNRRGDLRPGTEQFGIFDTCGEWSITCPYGSVGDRLWVRETFGIDPNGKLAGHCQILYRATQKIDPDYPVTWRPSIHMPRKVSRITLEITGVRVERLNEISEKDAVSEGISRDCPQVKQYKCNGPMAYHFAALWELINGEGSWALNPWVWVIEFKVVTPC